MRTSPRRPAVVSGIAGALGMALAGAMLTPGNAAQPLTAVRTQDPDADTAHSKAAKRNYSGTVALSNCSGTVVRWRNSRPGDKALMLTNGHCHGFLRPREVIVRKDHVRNVKLLRRDGSPRATVRTSRLIYATMYRTDVALYRLRQTYRQLAHRYRVPALTSARHALRRDIAITIPSGYWRRTFRCDLNGFVYRLHEGVWDWHRSLRYSDGGCKVIGGTSGSPVLNANRVVVGINNTTNEDGERCTLNNPCEENRRGRVSVHQGRGYGQQTWWFTTCLDDHQRLTLSKDGCRLPGP